MRILQVVHQFLPRHAAGTEYYTYYLSKALQRRGHDVYLYFTEMRHDRRQFELTRGFYDGLPYFEVVHNRTFRSMRQTWVEPRMERHFRNILDEIRPDVVHVEHLFLHSLGYTEEAKRRGIPVVYTLHEYMTMCLNWGQLLREGNRLCDGPDTGDCADCARMFPAPKRRELALAGAEQPAAVSSSAGFLGWFRRTFGSPWEDPYVPGVELRQREHRQCFDNVDLFLAPSEFLRQRFLEQGMVVPDRILHSDNGFVVDGFASDPRPRGDVLRVGYVGTIAEWKGVHLILEAFHGVCRDDVQCRIYGDAELFPDYKAKLDAIGTPPRVQFMGRVENDRVAAVLGELDLLIVPSLWYENSPLTIHEAFLARVPVLTADRGGMAELVTVGRNGLHFEIGDADDLRRQILRVLDEPDLLASLTDFPHVKTIQEDAELMEERYLLLLEGERPVR